MIAYLLIIAIAFFVIGFSLLQLVGEYLFNQRVKEDQRIADTLSEQMSRPLEALDVETMYAGALEMCSDSNARVLVLDSIGVVQVDTWSALNGQRFLNAEAAKVLAGSASSYGFYDAGSRGAYWLRAALNAFSDVDAMTGVFASAIYGGGDPIGAVIYISQVQEIYENLHEIQLKIMTWLIVVAISVIVMSMFVIRTITRPVGELREGIAKMTSGDFSARVNVRGHNEFAELAAAFNSMSERLELLDKSRNQFVSNASHELKTPLSTMKILIETILYQDPIDPGMTKEFLADVNKEIDRLSRIVSDLLTLVNIDSGGMKLNSADVDINELLLEQVKRLAPLARENGIELDCSAKEALEVTGDSVKLQQVIYNVIDNAIKYTPRGGEVHASLARAGKRAIIRVSDTGIGIPADDLPHIFDRFYRVDKARSRATGGTGLGLSIVKQIVQLHGGSIIATSEEGNGTTFVIELPLAQKKD
ncbi:MAG: sensor histidine kinase [Candidatus Faecivicinus sp.]